MVDNDFVRLHFDIEKAKKYQAVLDRHDVKYNLVDKLIKIENEYKNKNYTSSDVDDELESLYVTYDMCKKIYNKKMIDYEDTAIIYFYDMTVLLPEETIGNNYPFNFDADYEDFNKPEDIDKYLTMLENKVNSFNEKRKNPKIKKLNKMIKDAEKRREKTMEEFDKEIDKYKQQIAKINKIHEDF